ncbi:MlaA family lipoprotein [Roseicella frigidaeris]|uniref:VacJ family lipoprotein n=1 Tax=Roseicella frigidaeris TaxID=2230885 RepID=A0A327M686_9PROT|nr:VacJ family lipoprotein [Roseicella frigidaeris]RAI58440.1 VacJ family lipoprotein [Roseicella frigidaeris]
MAASTSDPGRRGLAVLALGLFLAGCATPPPASDPEALAEFRANNDPFEPANRTLYAANEWLDRAVTRPVAVEYRRAVPRPVRSGIRNLLNNIRSPVILFNDMLQGEPRRAGDTLGRFLINTTVGVAGLFDVADSWFGVPRHTEDFGQTLAVWGLGEGPYLFLPLFGPTNPRDLGGSAVDGSANLITWFGQGAVVDALRTTRGAMSLVDTREALIDPVDELRRTSLDPYVTYRSAYRQRRQADIENRLGPAVTSSTGAFLPTPAPKEPPGATPP